jgi:hypothetical protein
VDTAGNREVPRWKIAPFSDCKMPVQAHGAVEMKQELSWLLFWLPSWNFPGFEQQQPILDPGFEPCLSLHFTVHGKKFPVEKRKVYIVLVKS